MICPDQIPDEVVEAMRESIADTVMFINVGEARAAIAAALNAWPGVRDSTHLSFNGEVQEAIILPLPQEGE